MFFKLYKSLNQSRLTYKIILKILFVIELREKEANLTIHIVFLGKKIYLFVNEKGEPGKGKVMVGH